MPTSRLQIVNKTGLGADTLIRLDDRPLQDCHGITVAIEPDGLVNVKLELYSVYTPPDKEMSDEMRQRHAELPKPEEQVNIDLIGAHIEMFVKSLWPEDAHRPLFRIIIEPEQIPWSAKVKLMKSSELKQWRAELVNGSRVLPGDESVITAIDAADAELEWRTQASIPPSERNAS